MVDLTVKQLSFVETFLVPRRRAALGVDPVVGTEENGSDQEAQATKLRGLIRDIVTAKDLGAAVARQLLELGKQAASLLNPPVSAAEIRAAAGIVARMRDLHAADALRDLADRRTRADALRDRISRCTAPNAAEDEATLLRSGAEALTAGWADPPSTGQLDACDRDLPALEDLVRATVEAVARRAGERLRLLDLAGAAKVEGAEALESTGIEAAKASVAAALPEHPAPLDITEGQRRLKELDDLVAQIGAAVAARVEAAKALLARIAACTAEDADEGEAADLETGRASLSAPLAGAPGAETLASTGPLVADLEGRRDAIRAAVAARKLRRDAIVLARGAGVPGAVAAEREQLRLLREAFPDLAGAPSRQTMAAAELALTALQDATGPIATAVQARAVFAGKIAALLDGLIWGSGGLAARADAPPGLTDPLRLEVEAAVAGHALWRDPGRADDWASTDPGTLDTVLKDLGMAKDGFEERVSAVNAAVVKVADAAALVRSRIAAKDPFELSPAQVDTLEKAVEAGVKLLATDVAEVDAALARIGETGERTLTLQRALRALSTRTEAVDVAPAGASQAELARLTAARLAAREALGKVDP